MRHFGPTIERRDDIGVVVYKTKDKQWCACTARTLLTDRDGSKVFDTETEALEYGRKLSREEQ